MSITVAEAYRSPRLGRDNAEIRYKISGTDDSGEAYDALVAAAPAIFQELTQQDPEVERTADGWWEGRVTYGYRQPRRQAGESEFSFDTTGGTQHITHSLETIGAFAPSGVTPMDHQGAIGVTKDGNVEGLDIGIRVFSFKLTRWIANGDLNGTMVFAMYTKTWLVNTDTVNVTVNGVTLTFYAGELCFQGARGRTRGAEDWEISFDFAAIPNDGGIPIGPDITVDSKDGWDYLWVKYQQKVDAAANRLGPQPEAAYVERVLHRTALAPLFA